MGCVTDVLADTDAAAEGASFDSTLASCVAGLDEGPAAEPAGGLTDGPAGGPTDNPADKPQWPAGTAVQA